MYLNATGMHYDHSQYVTHLAKIRKLEEILSLFCFFKQNLRSIFFSFVQKANFVNLYSDVYVSVSVPDHANASKLRQSATLSLSLGKHFPFNISLLQRWNHRSEKITFYGLSCVHKLLSNCSNVVQSPNANWKVEKILFFFFKKSWKQEHGKKLSHSGFGIAQRSNGEDFPKFAPFITWLHVLCFSMFIAPLAVFF